MHRVAAAIRRAAIASARRSSRIHDFLCAAGFDQVVLDAERLRNAVEQREGLVHSDHSLV